MEKVEVRCDRCGLTIRGLLTPQGTVGYYEVDMGYWNKYAKSIDEKIVCDECLWADEAYLKDYPQMRK